MMDLRKEADVLEALRKKAKTGYAVYACGLAAAVLMGLFRQLLWAGIIAAFVLLLNQVIGGRDVREYRKQYRNIKLRNETERFLKHVEIAEKNLFPLSSLEKDGVMPGEFSKGVVRLGAKGQLERGISCEFADISFPFDAVYKTGKSHKEMFSGSYFRFEFSRNIWGEGAAYREDNPMAEVLGGFYSARGLKEQRWGAFTLYESEAGILNEKIKEKLSLFDGCSNGKAVMVWTKCGFYAVLRGRYLAAGEPDYKHEVTEDILRKPYFPELVLLLDIAQEWRNCQ